MFGPGALLILPFLSTSLFLPGKLEIAFLLACSAAGVLGQYLLTYGFLYVTAVEGAVISSSRILIAALLGPLLVADPPLTAAGWLGALILLLPISSWRFARLGKLSVQNVHRLPSHFASLFDLDMLWPVPDNLQVSIFTCAVLSLGIYSIF